MKTSRIIALASLLAFGIQIAFALLMLRWFAPHEVGEFSVISQVGFFWMTLALAQAPVSLLANHETSAAQAAQQAWIDSLLRSMGLVPAAALAVWFSQLALWPTLLWVALLALCQMTWLLAQSFTLRSGSAWQQMNVRVLPPLTAALTALAGALWGNSLGWSGPTLVVAALLGYALGATWLWPAWQRTPPIETHANAHAQAQPTQASADTRNMALRMTHTLADALLATAVVVVWQRLYGAQETGWMSALLRVLGFLPAVVHMAWAQVALAQGDTQQAPRASASATPRWLGLGAFVIVMALGAACAAALQQAWLSTQWAGVWHYIAPLVLWQGCACLSAAFSHRPFQTRSASAYSWACIALTLLQALVLLAPIAWGSTWSAEQHMWYFAALSSLGLLMLAAWMARLR
jgi:uncharacterized membrane protein YqaE (UPF0057 family)